MDRETKKRGKEENSTEAEEPKNAKKKTKKAEPQEKKQQEGGYVHRPPGLFDFPWEKVTLVPETEGWDLRDVFFSSLIDGRSAGMGVPGARLSPPITYPIELPDDDVDVDCIWSSVLREPLPVVSPGDSKQPPTE